MPIAKPTTAEIVAVAQRLGYPSAADDAEQYATIITDLLTAFDTVDEIDQDTPPPVLDSRPYHRPDPNEDPRNAWRVHTAITGAPSGPLAGKTIAVKDSIMVAGVPMTNGSDLLDDFRPTMDATVVTRVLNAGATIVGKTNCEYFCLSGGSHTSHHGPVHNPHRFGYSAGGSSSGSAVAVATGEVDLALGTDQAGSVRVPASYSGLVGLKPTHGLVPYTGIAPLDPILDHVGPMSATVADNAVLLRVIAGYDHRDSRQHELQVSDYVDALGVGVKGLRIGVLREGFGQPDGEPDVDIAVRAAAADVDIAVRAAAADLGKLGADIVDISVPMHAVGLALWMPILMHGMAQTIVHGQGFGIGRLDCYPTTMMDHLFAQRDNVDRMAPTVKVCALLAEFVAERHGQSYYGKAVGGVGRLRNAYDTAFQDVDLLLMPTTPQKAQPLPEPDASLAQWCARATEMFGNTAAFNVTHHPAISLPCGTSDQLPIGLMLVGRHFDEHTIYRAAYAYEQRENSS